MWQRRTRGCGKGCGKGMSYFRDKILEDLDRSGKVLEEGMCCGLNAKKSARISEYKKNPRRAGHFNNILKDRGI